MQAAAALDIDGDGRAEVLLPASDGASFEVLDLASDGGLALSSTTLSGPEVSWARQAKTVFVADVSGSGQASLVVARPGPSEGVSTLYATSLDAPPELLASVTDGYGAQTFVEYGGARDVFTAVDCAERSSELQAHTPRWPLVSAIVRPKAIGGGVERNDVDLHRYRGWCNGAVAYGGGFEQHIETAVVDVGGGVEPGVYEGFGVPVATNIATRADYSDRMGTFRGNVTKMEGLRWFPEEGVFTYNLDEAVEREYSDGFLHEWGVDEFYENEVGVPLWHPVGVKGTRVSEASTFYTSGECALENGVMECEASSAAERIHHSREERSFDEFGLVRSSASTSGDYCSDYEVLAWAELPFVRQPQEVLNRQGKLGGDGGCDFQDPSFAPFENRERWEFDSNGRVELHALDEGSDLGTITTYSWDGDGTLHTETVEESQWGGDGRTWTYSYDLHGNVDEVVDPLGHSTSYSWVPDLGLLVGVLDANAVLATTRFDGFGRVTGGRTFAGVGGPPLSPGTTTRYERLLGAPLDAPSPLRVVSTGPSGGEQLVEYDEHGVSRYSEYDISGDVRVFTQVDDFWAGSGARVATSTPAAVGNAPGPVESVEYDLHGREVLRTPATAALGVGETRRRYGVQDVVEEDGSGEEWTSTFADTGELVSTLDAEGILTCFYYGAGVRLRDVVVNPAAGACDGAIPVDSTLRTSTHYTYDSVGRTISRKLPGRSAELYEYRGFPELVRYEDGEHSIDYEYDVAGRVLSSTDENGTIITELEWDADADCPWGDGFLRRIKSEVSVDGTATERTFTYDRFGRLASSVLDLDSGTRQFRVDRRFDEIGRLAEIRHGGPGPRISYQHDEVGALSQIRVGDAPVWTATSHDVSGALNGIEFGNGLAEERSYHAGVLEWLTLLADDPVIAYPGSPDASTVVDSVSLEYDSVGRMLRKEIPHLGVEESYVHDDIGRLLRAELSRDGQATVAMVHQYSPIGSVLNRSGVGDFDYGDTQRPLSVTTAGSVTYAYDSNGRQVDRNGAGLTWNAWSKLDHVFDGEGLHVEFAYDGYGKKVRRVEFGPDPSATYFADGLDLKVDDEGETRRYRVSGPEGVVAVVVQAGDTEELLYAHGNEMGSTSVFTNQSGDVVERQDFDPFGRRRAPLGGAATWSGDSGVDIGFTGHRREESFGLMDMGGRYYDPHLARFAAPDPFVSAPTSSQGYDPFSYVRNDPLTYTDPSGYVPVPGLEGDWESLGIEGDVWYFSCIEGCGADLAGVFVDSIVEAARGDQSFLFAYMEGSGEAIARSAAGSLEAGGRNRRNQELARRRQASASPAKESVGDGVAGDLIVEVGVDAMPGVAQAHDAWGVVEAGLAYDARSPGLSWTRIGLASAAFLPMVGLFSKRASNAVNLAPNMGRGVGDLADAVGAASSVKWKGFSKGSEARHFEKHGAEFGDITQAQYKKLAKEFAGEAGEFREQVVGNFVVKFDSSTRRMLVGHAKNREIRTFYKADGRDADPFAVAVELARQLGG